MNKSLEKRIALITAIICGSFSIFIAFQLTANCIAMKNKDPLNIELIDELRQQLYSEPGNTKLKEEIRELDMLTRRMFFSSITFQQNGVLLLLVSLIITAVVLKILSQLSREPPNPGKFKEQDLSVQQAAAARSALWAAIGILIGFTVIVGLQRENKISTDFTETTKPQTEKPVFTSDPRTSWPNFRGPYGHGIAYTTDTPTNWDGESDSNILWKAALPRIGHNSPVVISNKVFISCADSEAREVLCYDADSGELLWRQEIGAVPGDSGIIPTVQADVSLAASSMATDGRSVFAAFATGNVVCFDLDGNRKWAVNVGPFKNGFGYASSLITHKDLLIMQIDEKDLSRVLALNTDSGKTAWETYREVTVCWSTPIIAETPTGLQLILNGHPLAAGYDPITGKELWTIEVIEDGEVAPSPAFADGVAYFTTEFQPLSAVKIEHDPQILWQANGDFPDVASPVATSNYVFLVSSSAVITCVDAKSGDILWTHDTPEGFYSSPILVEENIYVMDKEGVMHVFAAADTYKPLATSALGETVSCTPAFINGRIYIRGAKHLYCVGTK